MPRRLTLRSALVPLTLALSVSVVASGRGGHRLANTGHKGIVPARAQLVYLATALDCRHLASERARFTPLVVRGPDYTTTIDPIDACRTQSSGPDDTQGAGPPPWHWNSYVYYVPMRAHGKVRLTPGNQPTVTLNAARFAASRGATVYYVNCSDYYARCPERPGFQGRIARIEYFKDDDVKDARP